MKLKESFTVLSFQVDWNFPLRLTKVDNLSFGGKLCNFEKEVIP